MKQKNKISFKLVAYTDAAGKYSADAVRSGNEDNFFVDDDLTDNTTNRVAQDEVIQLGDLGMLMVVADGMGGMNAGEVASQIAIDTVREAFTTENLKDSIVATPQSRQKYLEQVIKTADKNIKTEARKDSSRDGMGSTIIMAWLYGDELTISWCGDSRAYLFNDKSGIRLISQDHSYVQELVNKGLLTYDQTFDHPQNNIITRSLGDPTKDAKPESKTLKIGKGDIILLCSDGLSGVLRDRKTYDDKGQLYPEENMEDIIRAHTGSMKECREALWVAAERGGWYDNVTAILCQIIDGPESIWATAPVVASSASNKHSKNKKRVLIYGILGLIVIAAIVGAFYIGKQANNSSPDDLLTNDSIPIAVADTTKVSDSVKPNVDAPESQEKEETTKPTVKEQIQKQAEEKKDTASTTPNGLTKINRGDSQKGKSRGNSKLTPIQDKMKQNTSDNPIAPNNPKKDNISDNPINNQ